MTRNAGSKGQAAHWPAADDQAGMTAAVLGAQVELGNRDLVLPRF